MASDTESVDDDNLFYFESDHLAVRGNRDYANVLRTIVQLQAQRILVIKHLEELEIAKKRYLENPDLLLEKLRNNEEVVAPNYMTIVNLPEIGHYDTMPQEKHKIKQEPEQEEQTQVVRGRLADETKPETFNQLWTCDEQRRLEELLLEYPVEAVEMRRFAKIAKALGNRTPQQVASRVQKYFKKLYDAGMPIPGRIPKNKRSTSSKIRNLFRPTTFFPAHNVPVQMSEDDFQMNEFQSINSPAESKAYATGSGGGSVGGGSVGGGGGGDDDDIGDGDGSGGGSGDNNDALTSISTQSDDIRKRMIFMLEKIRDEKRLYCDGYNPDPLAAKCESCQMAPVSVTRWRCNTCYCFLNHCGDCLVSELLDNSFEHLTHDVIVEQDV